MGSASSASDERADILGRTRVGESAMNNEAEGGWHGLNTKNEPPRLIETPRREDYVTAAVGAGTFQQRLSRGEEKSRPMCDPSDGGRARNADGLPWAECGFSEWLNGIRCSFFSAARAFCRPALVRCIRKCAVLCISCTSTRPARLPSRADSQPDGSGYTCVPMTVAFASTSCHLVPGGFARY